MPSLDDATLTALKAELRKVKKSHFGNISTMKRGKAIASLALVGKNSVPGAAKRKKMTAEEKRQKRAEYRARNAYGPKKKPKYGPKKRPRYHGETAEQRAARLAVARAQRAAKKAGATHIRFDD